MKLTFQREQLHHQIYLFGLALLVCCIPLSNYMLSISLFLLSINWLAEGKFRRKAETLAHYKGILNFASVFLVYVAGLPFSSDLISGLERVNNALPLLLLPVVMATSSALSRKIIKQLLLLFSAAVLAASMVCLIHYLLKGLPENGNFRNISIFMPHIRFAMMIDMAIGILLFFLINEKKEHISYRWLYVIAGAFLVLFLFFLRSATGIITFFIIVVFFTLQLAFRQQQKIIRITILSLLAVFFAASGVTVAITWYHNFKAPTIKTGSLQKTTLNGNPYSHNYSSGILENGHYTDLYFCETEVQREWNKISSISYDGFDRKGQAIRSTIKRYLTSRNLTKDSIGIHALLPYEILNIENGLANCRFSDHPGVKQRLYETLYEIHIFKKTGFAEQHSIGQRLLFLDIAWSLIREKFPFGYGTGDVYNTMYNRAHAEQLAIDKTWEGKPHNQFVFYQLAFGFAGLLWILFCWIYPLTTIGSKYRMLLGTFAIIILLSMCMLDTLESYYSIVFFAFFYCLFVFGGLQVNSYNGKN